MVEAPPSVTQVCESSIRDLTLQLQAALSAMQVVPILSKEDLRARLSQYDFAAARPLSDVLADLLDLLLKGNVHTISPRYFGLFNPGVTNAGIAGDLLAAALNPQVGAWWHAPAANEIESRALEFLCRCIGFDAATSYATFTSGGSESNLTAVLAALIHRFPSYGTEGLASLPRRPVMYASDQAHDSLVKIAHAVGLGRRALRRVRSDAHGRLEIGDLIRQIGRDRRDGSAPFLVAGTAGTTALGAIDPLEELASVCGSEDLWLHVDAAWGGAALLSDRLRHTLAGIEHAQSVTWDAHKTMPIPMGAGMIFLRGVDGARAAEAAFDVTTGYVPETEKGTIDLYRRSLQWSRRFIGLKVFFTLAEQGAAGVARAVEHQVEMGKLLREKLVGHGWTIINDTPLPLVCFSHPLLRPSQERVPPFLRRILSARAVWLSEVRLGSDHYLRACITNHQTSPDDVRTLVDTLNRTLDDLRSRELDATGVTE